MSDVDKDFLDSGVKTLNEAINHFSQVEHPEAQNLIALINVIIRVASLIL